jgi:hypothetical protein
LGSLGVITGLDPVIHDLLSLQDKDVDGRDKPGHDDDEESVDLKVP